MRELLARDRTEHFCGRLFPESNLLGALASAEIGI